MAEVVTYFRAGGPPDNWADLEIRDPWGYKVWNVIEGNAAKGWLVRYKQGDDGLIIFKHGEAVTERVTGKFTIERKELK